MVGMMVGMMEMMGMMVEWDMCVVIYILWAPQ